MFSDFLCPAFEKADSCGGDRFGLAIVSGLLWQASSRYLATDLPGLNRMAPLEFVAGWERRMDDKEAGQRWSTECRVARGLGRRIGGSIRRMVKSSASSLQNTAQVLDCTL